MKVSDIVKFRADSLFQGAVNIGWFRFDEEKAMAAAKAFAFHGPDYHGVTQQEIGVHHGHRLIDTANFTKTILKRSYGIDKSPFTLAIAGYGAGKSHLAITLAEILKRPTSETTQIITDKLIAADKNIGNEIRVLQQEINKPCIVLTIDGLGSFNLLAEIAQQIEQFLIKDGHDTGYIEQMRPKYKQAIPVLNSLKSELIFQLCEQCDVLSLNEIIEGLENKDENVYDIVSRFLTEQNMALATAPSESINAFLEKTVEIYCGEGKPYQSIVILFDEFGKYLEFSSIKSHIAGAGTLQDLFQSVQNISPQVCFVGFVQFELNAYMQRISPNFHNEMKRYISRYENSDKLYLSTNLETLIAGLIEKKDISNLNKFLDSKEAYIGSRRDWQNINNWFSISTNNNNWVDFDQFHKIIRKGAWPLSPYSSWLLYYFSSKGGYLQERSALSLLSEILVQYFDYEFEPTGDWSIPAVDLLNESLLKELLTSEEFGGQGTVIQDYMTIMSKYESKFSKKQIDILKSILLSSKLGLNVETEKDATIAISMLTNIEYSAVLYELDQLKNEYNTIGWDDSYKHFLILGETLPRKQFYTHIKNYSNSYSEEKRAQLFISQIEEIYSDFDIVRSDFSDNHNISTREWFFKSKVANSSTLSGEIELEADRCVNVEEVDEARGSLIFTYVGQNEDIADIYIKAKTMLKTKAKTLGMNSVPVLIYLLYDIEGKLGQALAELSLLKEFGAEEKIKYGNLIDTHELNISKSVDDLIKTMLRERRYVVDSKIDIEGLKIKDVTTKIFDAIYTKPIIFPFDGYNTKSGNASKTCSTFTKDLMRGILDYDAIMDMAKTEKNRSEIFQSGKWDVFNKSGKVQKNPTNTILKNLTKSWDIKLKEESSLSLEEMYLELIRAPYGANIASAGLLLGVYISARHKELLVKKNGEIYSINDWANHDIVKNGQFNKVLLKESFLLSKSDDTSEWISLLDEWEEEKTHLRLVEYLEEANKLKKLTPVPPDLVFRVSAISDKSSESQKILNNLQTDIDKIKQDLNNGIKSKIIPLLLDVCIKLKSHIDLMIAYREKWVESQRTELENMFTKSRLAIIQNFSEWLGNQTLKSNRPDIVGEFQHKMKKDILPKLEKLNFDSEAVQLSKYYNDIIQKLEIETQSSKLIQDVEAWLTTYKNVLSSNNLKNIRLTKSDANDYIQKLRNMYKKINKPELLEIRDQLSMFNNDLSVAEGNIIKKGNSLWNYKLSDENSIHECLDLTDSLLRSYEGLDDDIDDFRAIRKALISFRDAHVKLMEPSIDWVDFDKLYDTILLELHNELHQEELPWLYDEVLDTMKKNIVAVREKRSFDWTEKILNQEPDIKVMGSANANQLYNSITNPPAYIISSHLDKLAKVNASLYNRLSEIKLEWLIEKFKELPDKEQEKFLELALSTLS